MWTFDNPPTKRLQEVYGFTPTKEWLDKIRLASVRFMDGGSGSFVSADGLMITNHHVGLGCVQNVSTQENDYVQNGFLAAARDKEASCPGYEVNVLLSIEDVTPKVLGAVTPAMNDQQAREARKAATAQIEKACVEKTGLRCDVVTLYQGGEFHLYSYKKYTDVRLVFAPEQQAAFFGGDPDNFTFPRHDLDVAFFRAYENGRPVKPAAFLRWSAKGVAEGDLVFVSGNPGSTSRLKALAELEDARDVALPWTLRLLDRSLNVLREYSKRGPEQERRARPQIFSLENSQKALQGRLRALQDEKAMAKIAEAEKRLRVQVAAKPELSRATGDPWEAIAAAEKKARARAAEVRVIGFGGSRLLAIASQLVRLPVEKAKPNEVRLEEYRDSNLASLENRLFSGAPIYDDLEETTLEDRLKLAVEELGEDHRYVRAVLQGKTPAEAAKAAVAGSKLKDVAVRKSLAAGGKAGVDASTDPMVDLARRIDPFARELRKWLEDEIDAVLSRSGEKIAQARFKLLGKTVHPDATFTLRLAYGTVKSYPAEGTQVAPFTTFHGLFDRSAAWAGKPPWNLPKRYLEKKPALELSTPLDFVSTADIIGGNSGSPTVDRSGEFVGIIFDSNIQGLALDYYYTEEQARAVSVDSRGILEALRKLYEAEALVTELTARAQ
jgi:hypothetical protein